MEGSKQERMLEIFFRGLRGEDISIQKLAVQYGVSTKSISRTINDIKAFLADHRELVGNTELQYSHRDKCYRLRMDEFLTNQELFALIEVVIGARAFSKEELLLLTSKLKAFTTTDDRAKLNELIRKELYHYTAVKHDCESVQDMLWQLVRCITEKREITVEYFRSDRAHTVHRLRPASVMFTDFYFYLIAFGTDGDTEKPLKPVLVGDGTILEFIVSAGRGEIVIVVGRHVQCGEQNGIFEPVCVFRIIGEPASQ